MENKILITMLHLRESGCVPDTYTSFADLRKQIMANAKAKPISESPFWMVGSDKDQEMSVFAAAIDKVGKDKGQELAQWIIKYTNAFGSDDLTLLPQIVAECPDKSILPLA